MKIDLRKRDGSLAGEQVEVSEQVFGIKPNAHVMYQAVRAYMTNSRQGTVSTKTRSEVSGGGRKPWKQKGRGTARAGTIRSPLWVHGGRVFGPLPKDYHFALPKKMKRLARLSALSTKAQQNEIVVVEDFTLDMPKTREMYRILQGLGLESKKTLMLTPQADANLVRAGRNIPKLAILPAVMASTYDILNCEILLMQKSALEKLEGMLKS